MLRRLITPEEADELREAGDAIAMAAEGVVVMIDHFSISADRIAKRPALIGGTTLVGQSSPEFPGRAA